LPVSQTYLVSILVAVEVSIVRVISWDAVLSAAAPIPARLANFSSQMIAVVVATRVIPRDTLHIACITVIIPVTEQLQLKPNGYAAGG